jgi:hemolysin D
MTEPPVTSPTLRYTAWLLLALFMVIVIGSWFARTEIVARGTGRVVVLGRTQSVQPQFDGKIAELKVIDGMPVKAGELLVTLDATQANADVSRLSLNLDQAQRQLAIHEAMLAALNNSDPTDMQFVESGKTVLGAKRPSNQTAAEDLSFLEDALKSFVASAAEFDAQAQQLQSGINTSATRLTKTQQDRDLLQERVAKKGGVTESEFLGVKRDIASADQDIRLAENQKQELEAQYRTIQQSRTRYIAALRAEQQLKAADLRSAVATTAADLVAAKNRLLNTSIVSPVQGRIENLQVFTIGGFVQAGQTLMSVVPESDNLEIEALFQNRDAGFLQKGQVVFIKLDAYPAERFGIVKGKVVSVGADARLDDATRLWVYVAKIKPDQSVVKHDGRQYPIVPGMTGTTDVVTGDRRLLSYFFEPVVKAIQDGFQEQ